MRLLDRLEETLIATLMAAATILIFVAVVQRYTLGLFADLVGYARAEDIAWLYAAMRAAYFGLRSVNLIWAQEICIILFVWMAKFGAAYGVRTGIHVGIDVLINRLSPARRRAFVLFGLGAGAFFTGTIAIFGAGFVLRVARTASTTDDFELPMWIVYLAIPLGSSLMCFRFLEVAVAFARTGALPHVDHGHVDGLDTGATP